MVFLHFVFWSPVSFSAFSLASIVTTLTLRTLSSWAADMVQLVDSLSITPEALHLISRTTSTRVWCGTHLEPQQLRWPARNAWDFVSETDTERKKDRQTDRRGGGRGRVRPAETELEESLISGFQGFRIILSDRVKKEPGSKYHISCYHEGLGERVWPRDSDHWNCGSAAEYTTRLLWLKGLTLPIQISLVLALMPGVTGILHHIFWSSDCVFWILKEAALQRHDWLRHENVNPPLMPQSFH